MDTETTKIECHGVSESTGAAIQPKVHSLFRTMNYSQFTNSLSKVRLGSGSFLLVSFLDPFHLNPSFLLPTHEDHLLSILS